MASRFATLWPLDPHTLAKHAILRRYLDAWLPIMTKWNGRVVFVDGFSGPGRYAGGEDGSPIIALRAALEHRAPISANLVYIFIENDPARKANLEDEIKEPTLPTNVAVQVVQGRFDEAMVGLLDELAGSGQRLARRSPSLTLLAGLTLPSRSSSDSLPIPDVKC